MLNYMIIDSHTHLVKSENESFAETKTKYLSNLKLNKISQAIVIADNQANSETADTKTLIDIFSEDDFISIVGSIDPFGDIEEQRRYFEGLLVEKQIVGIKLFNGFDKLYPTDEKCFVSYDLAIKYKVPVIFHTGINIGDEDSAKYNDPKYIVEIAKKFPDLKILISHFYWPKIEYCFELTKDIQNIYHDSTVLADIDVIELIGSIEKVREVLENYFSLRPNNLLFGTDFPACKTEPAIALINSLKISDSDKKKIFSDNTTELFGL